MFFNFLREDILFLFLIAALFRTTLLADETKNPCIGTRHGAFVKDASNCANFFQCRRGKALSASCPDGMYFDPKQGICDIAANVFCPHDFIDPKLEDETIECPADDERGAKKLTLVASKVDCHRYYICYHGLAVKQECIAELHWNRRTERCDWPAQAKCNASPIRCTSDFERDTLPHPTDCSLYYYCIMGLPLVQRCSYFHHFDIKTRSCVWQDRAQCWATENSDNEEQRLKIKNVTQQRHRDIE